MAAPNNSRISVGIFAVSTRLSWCSASTRAHINPLNHRYGFEEDRMLNRELWTGSRRFALISEISSCPRTCARGLTVHCFAWLGMYEIPFTSLIERPDELQLYTVLCRLAVVLHFNYLRFTRYWPKRARDFLLMLRYHFLVYILGTVLFWNNFQP